MNLQENNVHPLHDTKSRYINTWSGKKLHLLHPDPDDFCIEDIAMGLSNICHFGGQVSPFFSVAQHCILTASIAPRELLNAALMHDAAEAYLGDVVKPLKIIIGEKYASIEHNFTAIIFDKFKISMDDLPKIKPFDTRIQEMEYDYFFRHNRKAFGELLFFNPIWKSDFAYTTFLYYATKLFKELA